MIKTNFIDVIKTFSKEEMKNFFDFANSPYYNSGRSVTKLVELVKKYHPDFENRNFTKEKIFAKIYSSEVYKENVMVNLMRNALQF